MANENVQTNTNYHVRKVVPLTTLTQKDTSYVEMKNWKLLPIEGITC